MCPKNSIHVKMGDSPPPLEVRAAAAASETGAGHPGEEGRVSRVLERLQEEVQVPD